MTSHWSFALKLSCNATLRRRGNVVRQSVFDSISAGWARVESGYRDFAPLKKSSYSESYLLLSSAPLARRLCRSRTHLFWGNEFDARRAESRAKLLRRDSLLHSVPRPAKLPRVDEPHDRACYLCPADSWMPETIEHLLLFCSHPQIVRLRTTVRAELLSFVSDVATAELEGCPPAPDLTDDVSFYAALQLCTSVGALGHVNSVSSVDDFPSVLRPMTRSRTAAALTRTSMDWRRRHHQLFLSEASMRSTASWTLWLTNAWRRSVLSGSTMPSDSAASTTSAISAAAFGRHLVDIVARHNQRLFSVRRKLLVGDVSYLTRARDPGNMLSTTSSPGTSPAASGVAVK